jgi:hypothetical protein
LLLFEFVSGKLKKSLTNPVFSVYQALHTVPRWQGLLDRFAQFFQLALINDGAANPLCPEHRYVFGYHPHGVVPFTAGWVSFSSVWRKVVSLVGFIPTKTHRPVILLL